MAASEHEPPCEPRLSRGGQCAGVTALGGNWRISASWPFSIFHCPACRLLGHILHRTDAPPDAHAHWHDAQGANDWPWQLDASGCTRHLAGWPQAATSCLACLQQASWASSTMHPMPFAPKSIACPPILSSPATVSKFCSQPVSSIQWAPCCSRPSCLHTYCVLNLGPSLYLWRPVPL